MITLCVLLGNLHIRRFTFLHATLNSLTYLQHSNEIVLWTTITNDSHIYLSQALVLLNMIITCKQSIKWFIFIIYNVLVAFYNN